MIKTKLLNNVSWLLFDKVIRIFGSLFISVWIARYLGPADYGVLNYAVAYVALFMLFVTLGLDQIVVRELVKNIRLAPYYLGTSFILKLIGALLALASIFISSCFIETDNLTRLVILIIGCALVFQSLDVIDFFYQSKVLSKYVVIARSSAFLFSSALNIYFIIYEYSVIYFAIVNVANALLTAFFLILVYWQTGSKILKWRFSYKIAKQLLIYSWPLAISVFLISIHTRIDQVMIGSMLDSEQVGMYSIAVKLAEFWLFMPMILVSTLMPYFINLRDTNNQLYHYRLMQIYSLMFWVGVFVGFVTVIFGEYIVVGLFGEVYSEAYGALVLNVWAGVFVAQSAAKGIWVISENKQMYRLVANIFAIILNVSLNVLLIPAYGINGAAFATLATRFANNWVTPLFIKPYRENTIVSIKSINPFYVYGFRVK